MIVEGMLVDVLFRAERVIVELDSWEFHSGWDAFDIDRERSNAAVAAGYHLFRLTWEDLTERTEGHGPPLAIPGRAAPPPLVGGVSGQPSAPECPRREPPPRQPPPRASTPRATTPADAHVTSAGRRSRSATPARSGWSRLMVI